MQYKTDIEIAQSCQLKHINEIAKTSGFNSIRTFNRIFKAHKGISPHEYRKCFNE